MIVTPGVSCGYLIIYTIHSLLSPTVGATWVKQTVNQFLSMDFQTNGPSIQLMNFEEVDMEECKVPVSSESLTHSSAKVDRRRARFQTSKISAAVCLLLDCTFALDYSVEVCQKSDSVCSSRQLAESLAR